MTTFFQNLSIARKLLIAFLAIVLASLGASGTIYYETGIIRDTSYWTAHTYKVLERLEEAQAAMVNQETGIRGYLIAGEPNFLDPFHAGKAAFSKNLAEVKELTADNPAQQTRLAEVGRLAALWRDQVAEKAIALMADPRTREEARQIWMPCSTLASASCRTAVKSESSPKWIKIRPSA